MQLTISNIPEENLVRSFVVWICNHFDVYPDTIELNENQDDQTSGQCIDVSENNFVILVKIADRKLEDVFVTIAHEMIHVKQYIQQDLGRLLEDCKDIPYMERWWEVEAFGESANLVRKFLNDFSNR